MDPGSNPGERTFSMTEKITVQTASLEEAEKIHRQIPEFEKNELQRFFSEKLNERKHYILIAEYGKTPVGYLIAYDRSEDKSIYCWRTATIPKYRKKGVLTQLMKTLERRAKKDGFNKLTIATRNQRRDMLLFLVEHGYFFTAVRPQTPIEENRIDLEKSL